MNNAIATFAVGFMVFGYGCVNHRAGTTSTITSPPTPATDKKLIKTDNQAAEIALKSDHQAVLPTTLATTRATDQIISSLRTAIARIKPSLQSTTQPADQNIDGTVTFTQVGSLLIVVAELNGFQPNSAHALEIHQSADLSAADLSSAGERWNVMGPDDTPVGLLGNVDADSTGRVYFERTLGGASVGGASVGGENNIVGHSIIVYAQPAGDAVGSNPRIAGGAIERHDQEQ